MNTIWDITNNITNWALSDLGNSLLWVGGAILVLGALNGVRHSWSHCGRTAARRGGRRA